MGAELRGLFGRDSLYMVLWVLQLMGAALVTPVATRLLRLDEYGVLASANAVMQILFVLAGCGIGVAVQRWFAGRGGLEDARGLYLLGVVVAAVVTAGAVASGPLWSRALGFSSFDGAVRLAVVWAGASAVTGASLGLLRSQDRLLVFGLVSLLQSVVAEFLSLALLVLVTPSATAFVGGQLVAQVAAMATALCAVRPRMLRRRDLALVRSGLRFALPLVPAMLGTLVLEAADRLMIHAHLGRDETARYQVAYNIGAMPILVISALDRTWLPRIFAVRDPAHRVAVLAASREALFRLLAPVVVGFSLGAPVLLRLWAPPDFRTDELLLVTTTVVLSALPYAAGMSARRGLLARSSTRVVAAATILAAVVNIGLNRALIPAWGLIGAAFATLVAYGLQQVVLQLAARVPGRARAWDRTVTVQALLGTLLALAAVYLPTSPLGLALRLFLGVCCLGWLLLAFRAILRGAATMGAVSSSG